MPDQNIKEIERIGGRVRLLPSLLSADFANLGNDANRALAAGAQGLHADIMDGHFVPPITFGADIVQAVIRESKARVDAHLMIKEPDRQVEAFAKAGVKAITVHAEACPHLHRVLWQIREAGCEAGVSVNPATPVNEVVRYTITLLDRVLIMSVNPGWGGQAFIHETLNKIHEVRMMLDELNSPAEIQIDGGVNLTNVGQLVRSGATELVAGTAVYKGNVEKNIAGFRKEIVKALSV